MAKIFLKKPTDALDDSIILQTAAEVLGAVGGNEVVYLNASSLSATKQVVMNQNIEGLTLFGTPSDFQFTVTGNKVTIYKANSDASVAVATIVVQGDANGTLLTFQPTAGEPIVTSLTYFIDSEDNFFIKLGDQVLTSTPASFGSVVPTPTFTVSETNGLISFSGDAIGEVYVAIDANNTATFTRENTTATTQVANVSAKTIDSTASLTIELSATNGDDSIAVNAPNATGMVLKGDLSGGNDKVVITVADKTSEADVRTLTVNTELLQSNEALVFDFADANDLVILAGNTVITGITALEVKRGTLDASRVDLPSNLDITVNSGIVLSVDQFMSLSSMVSYSEMGRLTVQVNSTEELTSLTDFIANPGAFVMIGVTTTINGAEGVDVTGAQTALASISYPGIPTLTANIEAVATDVTTNAGDIADNATAIGNLQTALNTLSTTVGTNDAAIKAIIGVPASGTGDTAITATGLYATIDSAITAAVSGIQSQIATLISDAVGGAAPTTDSIAGLKAALAALSTVVGDSDSGLVMDLNNLTTQVNELGSALTAGYTAAKSSYEAALTTAAASKALADTSLAAYTTAAGSVANASTAQAALTAAQDFYAKAITAKTDADNLVAKANTVTIAAAQTPSTADDTLVANAQVDAATAQTAAASAVIMANSNVNAATIVLSNATLDASNQVIVTFIDYSSAAAATTSDISAAQTAQNAYDAALVTFNNSMTVNNANALKTAATNFNTAAVKAATTAAVALEKANTSSTAADTTSSAADDSIADTNVTTATAAKNTADGLATTAATNLALATAYANVPVVQALAGVGYFETGFSVTAGAVVTVTVDGTPIADLTTKFTKTTENGVDTYTAKVDAFNGAETTIAVSAVMQTEIGTQTISSVAATVADLDIDTTAPVAPTVNTIEGGGTVNAADVTDGLQVTGTAESGSTVSVWMAETTKTVTAGTDGAFSVTFSGNEVPVDGSYGVDVKATDAAGNVSALTSPTISIDTKADADGTPLSIAIATDNEVTNLTESTAVTFTLAGIDSDAASVAVDFTDTAATPNKVTVNATKNASSGLWEVTTANLSTLTDGEITATVTVTDTAGNTATATDTLTLAATAAKVTTVALTAENEATFAELNAGDTVTATVTMDKAVTVTGSPTLTLVIGTTEVNAAYDATNSTTTALKFIYTILAEQTDTDGISIKVNGIVLAVTPAATIVDASGNNATLTFEAVAANNGYIVDTTVPTATATITALSADSEANAATDGTDFITKTAAQTVSGTFTNTLSTDEKIQVSVDGGTTWVETTAANSTWTTATDAITLVTGASTVLSVRTIDTAGNVTAGTGHTATLDQTAPTVTVSAIDISADTGVSASDFNTKTASQTISATLSTGLGTDESLWGSVDGGTNWTDITNKVSSSDPKTAINWNSVTLSGTSSIQMQVRDAAGNAGATATQAYVLDTTNPTATVTLTAVNDNVGGITGDIFGNGSATTDDTSLTLSGAVNAALGDGEKVVIYDTQTVNSQAVATRVGEATVTESNGLFTWTFTESREVTTSVLNDGYVANYSAVVEDLAGNQSTSTGNTFAATISTAPITSTAAITSIADDVTPVTDSITQSGAYTNDTIPALSGSITLGQGLTALPTGQVVAVYDGTARLGNATVTETTAGSGVFVWTYTDQTAQSAARLADGEIASYTVVIENTAVGTQGTMSTPAFVLNIDTSVAAPVINMVATDDIVNAAENANLVVSGTGEIGATVTLAVTNQTAVVDSSGNWSITVTNAVTSFAEGAETLSVTQTDLAGNVSTAGTRTISIDTLAPSAPTAVTLTAVGGTVKTDTLNSTNTNLTATATITAAEATDGKAELYIGDVKVAEDTSIASSDTTVSFDVGTTTNAELQSKIAAGGSAVVKLYDKAGNLTSNTTAPLLTVDYMAPATPIVSLTNDTFGGTGTNSDLYTSDTTLTITPLEANATRSYVVDNGSASATYTAPTSQGSHTVTVTDTDAAGNVSTAGIITFILDNTVTAPTISGLTNDTGASTTDKTTSDMSLTLSGVETDALVEYQVNTSGTWLSKAQYDALADGTYDVVVRQTDKAGNVSTASTALTGIVKDTAAPAVVTFTIDDNGTNTTDGVTSNDVVNISKADDVVKWEYTLNGTNDAPTWVTGTGTTFSLGTTDAMFAIGDIQVRGYDLAGNMTTATSNTTAYRLDKTAPMAATGVTVKHYDSNGDVKTGDYIAGDYIEFIFSEQLSAAPTKVTGDSFGSAASIILNDTATSALVQLKSSEAIEGGEVIVLQAIDLVGQQANISFTIPPLA